ncbi:alpha-amylase family glycosyl hydrolase [Jannaschia formosa]|uniref:alpha-amylase family glycosyl hydrolase n=1 Tax=Jannaschia formosa TaxID=2259592 RepID=UPI001430C520|nr:alpha-amylase family glycosyl hydrolase [Jannaschia formosa]
MSDRRDAMLARAILHADAPAVAPEDWWRGAVFYQIYLRSFRDGNGDGIGDLKGVAEKLDYLADLGIDGIWLAPFYASPQVDFGYDVSDMRAVDPSMGTIEDLKAVIEGAHDRGIRVLADFVPCHTSDQHEWFQQSRSGRDAPHADWYVWADRSEDGTPPNNWLSSFGGPAWTWEPRRSQYYYHPFLTCQPALNLRNEDALCAVLDAMAFWRDVGIDGFRLDAVQCLCWDETLRSNPPRGEPFDDVAIGGGPNNPFAAQSHLFDRDVPHGLRIIERMRRELTEGHPEFALIGELADVDSSRLAVKYTAGRERLHAVYDFDLIQKSDPVARLIETLRVRSDHVGSGWYYNVLTNHDTQRAVSQLTGFAEDAGRREEAAKLLLFLQATLRGGAIVFQGEELGLPQPEVAREDMHDPWAINLYPDFVGRDGVRMPFPWDAGADHAGFTDGDDPWMPVAEAHRPLAVSAQAEEEGSVLSFFKALLRWRREHGFLRLADETIAEGEDGPVLAFTRAGDGEEMTFLANLGLAPQVHSAPRGAKLEAVPGSAARAKEEGIALPPLGFAAVRLG